MGGSVRKQRALFKFISDEQVLGSGKVELLAATTDDRIVLVVRDGFIRLADKVLRNWDKNIRVVIITVIVILLMELSASMSDRLVAGYRWGIIIISIIRVSQKRQCPVDVRGNMGRPKSATNIVLWVP